MTSNPQCVVATVLQQRCVSCHDGKMTAGSPMGLQTYADLQASAKSNPSLKVFQAVEQRIHDTARPMPPSGTLPASELSAIDQWVSGGAVDCGFPKMAGQPPPGMLDPPPADAEECFELHAHNAQTPGDTTKFDVRAGEFYHNFVFKAPYDRVVTALSFDPLIDNAAVLHHWLLFQVVTGSVGADGSHADDPVGTHPNSVLIAGWAPGGQANRAPPDVSFSLPPPGGQFELEFHYFNSTGATAPDSSGVRVCITSKPVPNLATITWLGTEDILILPGTKSTASGTCTPKNPGKQDIHILSSSPHMHKLGTHMTTIVNRADGGHETLHDAPFAFSDQRMYVEPMVIHPGDTLSTTCTYENASSLVLYGSSTTDEMCYNFVAAYPANALSNPGASLEGSQNTCLQ
jgi:hypothetical protein